jgi:8-oxo-dGTP pyrophosphatase MutT (NUDIX family)
MMRNDDYRQWTLPCFEEGLTKALGKREKRTLSREGKVVAAVLIPLFGKDGDLYVLLTKRSHAVEHHKGEISFPGGRLDESDPDLLHCALRETSEEVGIEPEDVRIVGELDDFYTVATEFLVVPFVGFIPYPYNFKTDSTEIDTIIGVPLEVFFDPGRRSEETWVFEDKPIKIISYQWRGHTIWGATARILDHFTRVLRDNAVAAAPCGTPGPEL